jgi:sec-independent protein translocase protein TatB
MLPEIGASELIVLAAVALIVVGPKDLPVLLRRIGQFVAKLRGFAADFRASFDEMARQSELDDLRKEVEQLRSSSKSSLEDLVAAPAWDNPLTTLDSPEPGVPAPAAAEEPQPSILPPAQTEAADEPAKPKARRSRAKPKPAPEEPA